MITRIVITMPHSIPFDAEVMRADAMPGDVCNRYGDLRGADSEIGHSIVKSGVVYVRPDQAKAAAPFGWGLSGDWPPDAALVMVERSL